MEKRSPKVAVIAREPAAEPLRMATGLTSVLDDITVFVVDHRLSPEGATAEHIEALRLMGARIMSNVRETPFEYVSDAEMASILASCDTVIAY